MARQGQPANSNPKITSNNSKPLKRINNTNNRGLVKKNIPPGPSGNKRKQTVHRSGEARSGVKRVKDNKNRREGKISACCTLVNWIIPGGWVVILALWMWKHFSFKTTLKFIFTSGIGFYSVFGYLNGQFNIPPYYSITAGVVAALMLFLFFHYSKKARCIIYLCLPEMSSYIGRTVLAVFLSWIILGFPLDHMIWNFKELARGITCSGAVVKYQTEFMKLELLEAQAEFAKNLLEYFENIMRPINSTFDSIDEKLETIQAAIAPVKEGFEWFIEECETEFQNGFNTCSETADNIYRDCHSVTQEKISWLGFMCAPVFWTGSACKEINVLKMCDIFEPLVFVDNMIPAIQDQVKKLYIGLQIEIEYSREATMNQDVDRKLAIAQGQIEDDISFYADRAVMAFRIIHYIMSIGPLVILPLKSYWFYRQYFQKLQKDVDVESHSNLSIISAKKGQLLLVFKIFFILLKVFITGTVFVSEFVLYSIMNILKDRGAKSFNFEGGHKFEFDLKNSTMTSSFFKTFTPVLNVTKSYNFTFNPTECLPNATPLSPTYIYLSVGGLYAFLLFITWQSAGLLAYRDNIVECLYGKEILKIKRLKSSVLKRRRY